MLLRNGKNTDKSSDFVRIVKYYKLQWDDKPNLSRSKPKGNTYRYFNLSPLQSEDESEDESEDDEPVSRVHVPTGILIKF